jgi:hypothetical protein
MRPSYTESLGVVLALVGFAALLLWHVIHSEPSDTGSAP